MCDNITWCIVCNYLYLVTNKAKFAQFEYKYILVVHIEKQHLIQCNTQIKKLNKHVVQNVQAAYIQYATKSMCTYPTVDDTEL